MIDWDRVRSDLISGKPILIYDLHGREEEVDMVFYAGSITYRSIRKLRMEAGGQICYVMPLQYAKKLELPYIVDLLGSYTSLRPLISKKPRYGDFPPYSISVNHISVKTGISDIDREKTIRVLHSVVELIHNGQSDEARAKFYSEFFSPGHVPILLGRDLRERKGHTELSLAVSRVVNLVPSMVIAEMLDEGTSLSIDKARKYALQHGYQFLMGEEIIKLVL